MNESILMKSLLFIAVLVAVLPIGLGLWAFTGEEWGSDAERIVVGCLRCLTGIAMVAGLLMSRSRPTLGIALVALGAIAISAMLFWVAVVTLPIGAAMVFLAYCRARQAGWPFERLSSHRHFVCLKTTQGRVLNPPLRQFAF